MENFLEKKKQLPQELQRYLDSPQSFIDMGAVYVAFGIDSQMMPQISKFVGQVFVGMQSIDNLQAGINAVVRNEQLASGMAGAFSKKIFSRFADYFQKAKVLGYQWEVSGMKTKVSLEEAERSFTAENKWLFVEGEPEEEQQKTNGNSVTAAKRSVEKLPIFKAMGQFPRIMEQVLTNEKIRLRNQSELQRPTLSNWIHYYRDELGIGFHDQVQRGRFLFQSENGKRLTSEERERLNLILKSIEEELPLDIDIGRQVILFPNPASAPTGPNPTLTPRSPAVSAPAHVPAPQAAPPLSAPAWAIPQPPHSLTSQPPLAARPKVPPVRMNHPDQVPVVQNTPRFIPAKPAANVTGETLRFSTGHVLPAEHDDTQSAATMPTPPAPTPKLVGGADGIQSQSAESQRTPFSIRPVRPRRVEYKHEE